MRGFIKEDGFLGKERESGSNNLKNKRRFVFPLARCFYCRPYHFIVRLFLCLLGLILFSNSFSVFAQQPYSPQTSAQFTSNQPYPSSGNYLKNSAAFRQEIMKMEINVVRGGQTLPITQVPRVQKDDMIRMHLLEESAGGIKPNESMWNWTFLVAFVNPNRKSIEGNTKNGGTVSEEIQFRKTGWYKEYAFKVPYDSQPVFFLYPKPKYRGQILKLVNRKYEEVRELGEKTIELANAYSRIDSFLSELQGVLYRTQSSYYGSFVTYPHLPANVNSTVSNPYGSGTYNPYNPYPSTTPYNPYNPYGTGTTVGNINNRLMPDPSYNFNAFFEQTVERLAASFNINLPSCWQTTNGGYSYFGTPGGYGSYGSSYGSFGSSYGSSYGNTYGTGGNSPNSFGHAVSSEFIGRAQCVAKNIRMEDFDFSVGKLLQEGGMFALTQLRDKYPQLAYYINLAAVAIEFIVRVFQKYPMKIVPTLIQTSDGNSFGATTNNGINKSGNSGSSGYNGGSYSASASNPYPSSSSNNSFTPSGAAFSNSASSANSANPINFQPVKITIYAESQPSDTDSVTAYPVIVHRWQSEPDPEVISLNPPIPVEPCLHAGVNILKSADISKDESQDTFTRDFKLLVTSPNGFSKIFPLKKNIGAGGWELSLTNEDINSFPKIQMTLEAEVTGTRGFNELKSPKFALPLNTGSSWQIKPESQKAFAVGGKRVVTLQNTTGTCRCLQAVIYKPSFGGQFVFEVNAQNPNNGLQFSSDGREVSFEVDATNFQPGQGTLELKTYGDNQPPTSNQPSGLPNGTNGQNGQSNILSIKLYPLPPEITDFRIAGGDRQAVITGNRLEQLRWVKVNGKKMIVAGNSRVNQNDNQNINQNNNQMPNISGNQLPVSSGGQSSNLPMPNLPAPNVPLPGQPISSPSIVSSQLSNPASLINASAPDPGSSFPANPNERSLMFEDQSAKQEGGSVSLELGLDDDRSFSYPAQFKVKPSRPAVVAENNNEIEGTIVSNSNGAIAGSMINGNNQSGMGGNIESRDNTSKRRQTRNSQISGFSLKDVFPINTKEISVELRNVRTDYDFKPENLSIETRIENGGANIGEMPRVSFEVFDWKSMRLNIALNDQIAKIIGGRRLQFRLRDSERGNSDWYTIKQTFVRIPEIKTVRCTNETNGQCELKGYGIEYVGQISIDGGKTWFPNDNQSLQVRQTADGQSAATIPLLQNKKLLMIKFRDFPKMGGVNVTDFTFSVSARILNRNNQPGRPDQNINPNPIQPAQMNGNQTPNQLQMTIQNENAVQTQPSNRSKSKPKTRRKTKP